ncbi:acyltransferase [Sphingomonas sp. AP4-R1]|uniref:acyltransferase family protein n=1 Tax=Sphingomonas sp. AP4-R1 TaxID=2735134 RepID=UPI0014932F5D|nr:acyltransferase [Sphingomonas sp. AP4-R1]QJU57035.1 acyltransferase [Sphingomonas sp. AP4-R1]
MGVRQDDQRRVFHILDLLRAVAALAVVGHHLGGILDRWLPASPLAVDLFFVLSGFVISHAYDGRLRSGRLSASAFFRLRIIRLYPLYILGTLLMLALVVAKRLSGHGALFPIEAAVSSLAFAALFLPTPNAVSVAPGVVFPLNNPAWSLFWELAANLAYALLIRRLSRAALAALVGVGALLLLSSSVHYGGLNIGGLYATFPGGMGRVVFGFFCGVGIEHLHRRGRLPGFSLPAGLSAIILLLVFAFRPAGDPALYDAGAVLIAFPLLVALSLGDPPRWMEPICSKLGVASYAIYALQTPFLDHFAFVEHGLAFELGFLAVLTAIALVADAVYDRPVRRFLSRRFAAA